MKVMTSKFLAALIALSFISCATPYAVADLSILAGRSLMPVIGGIIDGVDKAKKEECSKKGKPGEKPYDDCYASTKKMVEGWTKGKPIALALLDEIEAIVRAARSANRKDVKTWIPSAKKLVCLLNTTTSLLEKKWQDNAWFKVVQGFAVGWAQCGKTGYLVPVERPMYVLAQLRKATLAL